MDYLTITKQEVREFLKYLDECGRKNSSISRCISSLRTFYSYLMREGKIESNIFKRISNPKVKRKLPNFLSEVEMFDILNSIPLDSAIHVRNRLVLELLYATGLRISELINIKIKDISFSEKLIKVMGKGSKERIVYYGEYAEEILNIYLKEYRHELDINNSEYLLLLKNGEVITPHEIKVIIDEALKLANVHHKVTAHTFRHTFATHLLNNGADIKVVQELLGHESLSTTQIYTHVTSERLHKEYLDKFPRN